MGPVVLEALGGGGAAVVIGLTQPVAGCVIGLGEAAEDGATVGGLVLDLAQAIGVVILPARIRPARHGLIGLPVGIVTGEGRVAGAAAPPVVHGGQQGGGERDWLPAKSQVD